MSEFFDTLAADHIRTLPIYQPGKPVETLERELGISGAIKVASNENPMGPSPRAVEAVRAAALDMHRYPDGGAYKLRAAVAAREGVREDELLFGAGSNEIIYLLVHALCVAGRDEVLTHQYAFISYRLAPMAFSVDFVEAEVTPELACDPEALARAMSPRTKLVFLANPNNPTGSGVTQEGFEHILAHLPPRALLVCDEAYHEYAAVEPGYVASQRYRTDGEPRIVTLRTFSKIYGLSGLRVGYAIGDHRVLDLVGRVRRAFNVGLISQAAATAALDDEAHVTASRDAARRGIEALHAVAARLGLTAYPSAGNFALIGVGRDADPVYEALLRRGVIVRPMRAWGLPEHLRITVGTEAETERTVTALAEVLG